MTKKDYEAIANSINKATLVMHDNLVNKEQLVSSLVSYCQADNPNFTVVASSPSLAWTMLQVSISQSTAVIDR